MATQTQIGKAFEYALFEEANNIFIASGFTTTLIHDASYLVAQGCFNIFNARQQARYIKAANEAVKHIIKVEPRLVNITSPADTLTLQLQPDAAGKAGDVRDLLFIRSSQNWEIGVSAKNNHAALKHSRLSHKLDFGNSWVSVPCSANYWASIMPLFNQMKLDRAAGILWKNVPNKPATVYQPLLNAFQLELLHIDNSNPNIPQLLASYIIGQHDFYKVIKRAKTVEVHAFNLNGSLGRKIGTATPVAKINKLALPTQIVQFQMKVGGSGDTLEMICDKGWTFSFRIHTAKGIVEPSLKFDVNLIGQPIGMHSVQLAY